MGDTLQFDPDAIDRAIQHLKRVLSMMDPRDAQVAELQHVTQPGAAPATKAFHGLLGQSMAKLRLRHEAFRRDVEKQIEQLKQTKRSYTTTDRAGAAAFIQLGQQA